MAPLLTWYDAHRRDLPWRQTNDPYAVWVSEIMLQQTQVATVIPYWLRWMQRFPTVQTLALANEQEVLSLWQGLGYYRRCRMLLAGAQWVAQHGLPIRAEEWQRVPGVGKYTAGAITSIAQGTLASLVDGNVERVYARLTADASTEPKLNKRAWEWADHVLHPQRPGDWNQALMELGATVCTPSQPNCPDCPVQHACAAFATGAVEQLPTRTPKAPPIQMKQQVWVPLFEGKLGVRQIPDGEWWHGMWEFPRGENIAELEEWVGEGWVEALGSHRHSVTNHRILLLVSLVRCEAPNPKLEWKDREELEDLPMPAPQRKVLSLFDRYSISKEPKRFSVGSIPSVSTP